MKILKFIEKDVCGNMPLYHLNVWENEACLRLDKDSNIIEQEFYWNNRVDYVFRTAKL